MRKLILATLFISLFASACYAQVSVASTNGYNVNVSVTPRAIVPTSNSCQWGYNYNVRLSYSVSFTGNNIPASLYTLQATIGCGSSTHFFNLPNNGGSGSVLSQSNVWNPNSDCNTATVSSLGCNTVNLEIAGPGISNQTVSFSVSAAPLPVTLIDFTAAAGKSAVMLDWTTATETGNDRFSIERSQDGINWKTIGAMKGAGNSSEKKAYHFTDNNPESGISYYRLKQTDIDQHYSYSDVRKVLFTETAGTVSVFPVPNTGNTVFFNGLTDPLQNRIQVYTASGTEVYRQQLNSSSVVLPDLKPGLYIIRVANNLSGETSTLKYIQQ